jgi:sugar O-acyltransferase (sialic acid O-acetyltransferase NeuD family)
VVLLETKKYIIWGGKGLAKEARESLGDKYELDVVFDNDYNIQSPFDGVPIKYGVEGFKDWAKGKDVSQYGFVISIGGAKGQDRLDIAKLLSSYSLFPLKIIHPYSYISPTAVLGDGCQILAMASVSSESSIGDQTIINNHANVDHECIIGNGVHLSPGATLAGNVVVEDLAWIATNATIFPRITIGSGAIVGAGAVVRHDIEPNTIVAGNPAKMIRKIF